MNRVAEYKSIVEGIGADRISAEMCADAMRMGVPAEAWRIEKAAGERYWAAEWKEKGRNFTAYFDRRREELCLCEWGANNQIISRSYFSDFTCPAMEHILGDSTGENAVVCGATVEAGEMFCSQHKEEN